MTEQVQTSPCNLCGGTLARLRFVKFGHQIVACRSCSLEFLHPQPTPEALAAFYDQGYFTGDADRRGYLDYVGERVSFMRSFNEKLDRIQRHLDARRASGTAHKPIRFLDVGTAAGFCVEAARDRGWDAWGLEVSEYAAAQAQARGLQVLQGDSLALFEGRTFDVITLWDALEHLLDPRAVLEQACDLLADDGLLVFSTGDVGHPWSRLQGRQHRIYNPPQHLFYFSRRTMTALSERAGLTVVCVEPDEKITTLHYVLHIARNLVDIRLLSRIFELMMRMLPNLEVRMKLIDNLVVYATPTRGQGAARPRATGASTATPRGET